MPFYPPESRRVLLIAAYEDDPDYGVWTEAEEGTFWYNTAEGVFKMWDGRTVRPFSKSMVTVSALPPSGGNDGDVWFQYYTI